MHTRTALGLLVAFALGAAAHAARTEPPAVLDALFGDERTTVALHALETRATLGAGEIQRVVEIGRDAASSHHVVAIRDQEVPHRHDHHDLLVVVLEGHGTMRLGDEERPVGRGSILWIPRGTVHAFRNTSETPAFAYAVYLPAFDGSDRVAVDGSAPALPGGARGR
jgi:mannose-6-phosphate isomerase-like protein (cupin superfamily)